MNFVSKSEEDTKSFAKSFAKDYLKKGGVIALCGDLGAGKTTFTQGFAQGLKIKDKVISPTFVLIRQHQIPNSKRMLFHLDLYRIEGKINLHQLGFEDMIENPENIILIEWAQKLENQLPSNTVKIKFGKNLEEKNKKVRLITID